MSKTYNKDIAGFMDDYLLEPVKYFIGDDFDLFPSGITEDELNIQSLDECKLKAIHKESDSTYRITATFKNPESHDFEFVINDEMTLEATIISSADCMLWPSSDNCLYKVLNISETFIEVKLIGIENKPTPKFDYIIVNPPFSTDWGEESSSDFEKTGDVTKSVLSALNGGINP